MPTSRLALWGSFLCLIVAGCMGSQTVSQTTEKEATHEKSGKAALSDIQQVSGSDQQPYRVRMETSKGDVLIEVHPEWAPRGAKRFRELVEMGFYDDCRFFRVIEGFMAQVGINGDPAINGEWSKKKLRDDPVIQSNKPGFVTFATSGPGSRTTQLFFNIGNNAQSLDRQGFAPFGKVIEGQEFVEALYNGYGDEPKRTPDEPDRSPDQGKIGRRGNAYLKADFPKLDYIIRATVEPM